VADTFKCGQAHDGSATDGPNDWLAKKFDEMHDMYQGAKHKNDFQVRGYQKGGGFPSHILDHWLIQSGGSDEAYEMADCQW
jgi:DNA polymerase lambda